MLVYLVGWLVGWLVLSGGNRPDRPITSVVDWALKVKYLSVLSGNWRLPISTTESVTTKGLFDNNDNEEL